ncbi:macromolecule metabolism; macromolecule synthesis, modification; dna - replication, repair, restr./modif [Azospirillum argentinense]|uniref:DNA cytosine methyltransferase n=1 Tax=Azospirillum argentinense TaxID=2970906 RepID=UPI0032DE74DC
MVAYYNEFDPGAAAWLRELIAEGHIAPGDVDTRSIADVQPDDLKGYTQAHFFAGIGGWSLALRLGGWPDDRPVWTGSCPCQPFSAAGKRRGTDDERHLWPEFRRLIAERRPPVVFGEQVASKARRDWLAAVRADLEALGHAVGAADLCSASVGSPNIRQRLWWVADAGHRAGREPGELSAPCGAHEGTSPGEGRHGVHGAAAHRGAARGVAHAPGREQWRSRECGSGDGRDELAHRGHGAARGPWSDLDWLSCRDGKARPVEPGTFPLAHGVPGRVGLLRGYGNAINPHVAAQFIGAFLDVEAGVSLDLPEPANQSRRFDRTA